MGSVAFHQMQENEFTQSQSSQGESPYQRDAFVSFYFFSFFICWGGGGGGGGRRHKSILKSRETFFSCSQPTSASLRV